MNNRTLIVGIFLLLVLTTTVFSQYDTSQDLFTGLLTPEQMQNYGLYKLSQSERNSLANYFVQLIQLYSFSDSAVEYLKNQGWEEIRVLGTRRLELDEWSGERSYLLVEVGYRTYICRPNGSYSPGKYLGQRSGSSINIIDSNGYEDSLRIEKEM